jgi:hypothetical protein
MITGAIALDQPRKLLSSASSEDGVVHVELPADLEHVLGVAVESAVAVDVVCGQFGVAGTDVVEEDHAIVGLDAGATRRHMW